MPTSSAVPLISWRCRGAGPRHGPGPGYLPIVFDFERPTDLDFTETIKTLAGLCLFVVADITNPRSSPLELQATVPDYVLPFVPILQEGEPAFAMFQNLQSKNDWVTDVQEYDSVQTLLAGLEPAVITPALELHDRLLQRKAQGLRSQKIREILARSSPHVASTRRGRVRVRPQL